MFKKIGAALAVVALLVISLTATASVASHGPDLTVSQAVFNGTVVQANVRNVGDVATPSGEAVTLLVTPPAGAYPRSWTINGSGSCQLDGANRVVCSLGSSMAPGALTTVYVSLSRSASGTVAEVDPFNRIVEFDEANNTSVAP